MAGRREALINRGPGWTITDSTKLYFGSDKDVEMYFDGTDFHIDGPAGITLTSTADDIDLITASSKNVRLLGGAGLLIYDSGSTDFADFSHDGTDFNTSFTNTTDWNINSGVGVVVYDTAGTSGLRIHQSTTDSRFIPHGSANTLKLLNWTAVQIQDGAKFRIFDSTDTDHMEIRHNGVSVEFSGTNIAEYRWLGSSSRNFNIEQGMNFYIFDSTNTDSMRTHHDGTRASSTYVNCLDHLRNDRQHFRPSAQVTLQANRLTNDGTVITIHQADTQEGDISVSGTTVSYNGAHLSFQSQLPAGVMPRRPVGANAIVRGTVMEYVNEKAEWFFEEWIDYPSSVTNNPDLDPLDDPYHPANPDGVPYPKNQRPVRGRGNEHRKYPEKSTVIRQKPNEQRMRSKVSDTAGSKAVAGVFERWDDDQTGTEGDWEDDFMVATTGDFVIRVTGPCEIGDLLESNGDGTARVQADDIVRSSTIAKAVQAFPGIAAGVENPELVPCQLLNG
jgi:hypothetical protein